jgi:hypothetical protein
MFIRLNSQDTESSDKDTDKKWNWGVDGSTYSCDACIPVILVNLGSDIGDEMAYYIFKRCLGL